MHVGFQLDSVKHSQVSTATSCSAVSHWKTTFYSLILTHATGNAAVVEALVEGGADVEAGSDAGPPLLWAAGSGSPATVAALLAAGASPAATAPGNVSAAFMAAASGAQHATPPLLLPTASSSPPLAPLIFPPASIHRDVKAWPPACMGNLHACTGVREHCYDKRLGLLTLKRSPGVKFRAGQNDIADKH